MSDDVKTIKFGLTPWQQSYVSDLAKHANNKKIANNLRDVFPHPYTDQDAEWYVNNCIEQEGHLKQLCRAIVVAGEAVGSIGVFLKDDVYRKNAELGYWLSEEYWGKGIMSRAVKQICAEAFEQFDLARIYAEPYADNIGSRQVLEKAGFELEGVLKKSVFKNNQYHDACIYALLKE